MWLAIGYQMIIVDRKISKTHTNELAGKFVGTKNQQLGIECDQFTKTAFGSY